MTRTNHLGIRVVEHEVHLHESLEAGGARCVAVIDPEDIDDWIEKLWQAKKQALEEGSA